MTGRMYQTACIVAAAKYALQNHIDAAYIPSKYVRKMEFRFLKEKGAEPCTAFSISDWYRHCAKNGLQDIKLFVPRSAEERQMLGFSDRSWPAIVCFYENCATYFTGTWKYDRALQMWDNYYTECVWPEAHKWIPHFSNNKDSFLAVLSEIQDLALKLECNYFAGVFENAQDILLGRKDYTEKKDRLPSIPEKEKLNLFEAADVASVFGGMGSWNDSPEIIAQEKGLGAEYYKLSAELSRNIDLAVLYTINEW